MNGKIGDNMGIVIAVVVGFAVMAGVPAMLMYYEHKERQQMERAMGFLEGHQQLENNLTPAPEGVSETAWRMLEQTPGSEAPVEWFMEAPPDGDGLPSSDRAHYEDQFRTLSQILDEEGEVGEEDVTSYLEEGGALYSALKGGATHLHWMLDPAGESIGVSVRGSGTDFVRSVRSYFRFWNIEIDAPPEQGLLGPVDALLIIFGDSDSRFFHEERVGRQSWVRFVVLLEDFGFTELQQLMEDIGFAQPQLENAQRFAEIPDASVVSMGLMQVQSTGPEGDEQSTGFFPILEVEIPVEAEVIPDDEPVGEDPVVLTYFLDSDLDRSWIRRPGLDDEELVEWQLEQGMDEEIVERTDWIREIHDTNGPSTMAWEMGRFHETLVYLYDQPRP